MNDILRAKNITGDAAVTLNDEITMPCYTLRERDGLDEWHWYLDKKLSRMFLREHRRTAANDEELIDFYIEMASGLLDEPPDRERLQEKTRQARLRA